MHIKTIAVAGAIAFAATVGAASAAELSTLKGISAEPMNAAEMAAVRGTAHPRANDTALPPGNDGTTLSSDVIPSEVFTAFVEDQWFGKVVAD